MVTLRRALPPGSAPNPERPSLTPTPAEEDWLFLRDPAQRADWLDRIKYIPLGNAEAVYLSLGGEFRSEYERFDSTGWGVGPQDTNGYCLQRILAHADLHLGKHFRLFSELQFDDICERIGGPRPGIDRDRAALHQTFAEFGSNLNHRDGTSLRVGRQEIVLGTHRLFDDGEGVNVKTSFDGALLSWKHADWRISVLALKPVQINPGIFDDSPNFRQTVWGIYTTVPFPVRRLKADFYYLGLDTKQAMYFSGRGPESRSTFGLRIFNRQPGELPSPGLDYNWEAIYQGGSFAGFAIRAWSIATETGYTWQRPLKICLALRADVESGDGDAADHRLNTFNPLFPSGAYFGPKLVLLTPSNLYDVHPVLALRLRQNVTMSLVGVWFWRQNIHDGIYSPGSFLLRAGGPIDGRFVGTQGNLEVRWAATPHVTIALNPALFLTGTFLQKTQPAHNIAFLRVLFTYRF